MKKIALFIINFYKKHISKLKITPCCRFYPSCSTYTYEAIVEHGVFVGVLLGFFRILRCNPLFRGGVDLVPKKRKKPVPKTKQIRTRVPKKLFYSTDIFYFEYKILNNHIESQF